MIKIKCRCGESEKNFKVDIGPFFINKCCMEAGYDKQGNKSGEDQEPEDEQQEEQGQEEESQEEVSEEASEEIAQAVEMTNEEAQDAKEEPNLSKMKFVELQELCKQRGIEITKDDRSKQSLIDKLQA